MHNVNQNGVLLIKVGSSKIINIANVNIMTYQGKQREHGESVLTVMFHSKQSDDTNTILKITGPEADDVWAKVNAEAV